MTRKDPTLCTTRRCTNKAHARGLCRDHYRVWLIDSAPACKRKGCTNGQHARGLCRVHYGSIIRKERRASIAAVKG